MGKLKSASDYITPATVNYGTGIGYYTSHGEVSSLLQCQVFGAGTVPSNADVGKIIKRVEGKIDDTIKTTYRGEIVQGEVHDFVSLRTPIYPVTHWKDYVGFVQLYYPNVRKIVRLEIYEGDSYVDIASAIAEYTPSDTVETYTLAFHVGPAGGTRITFTLTENSVNGFYNHLGNKTSVLQICSAINETYPADTAQFTLENSAKATTNTGMNSGSYNISDFFYAAPSHDGTKVKISSLLPSDAGTICSIDEVIGSTTTPISFVDKESYGREEEFWTINEEGRIFFRTKYPFFQNHSVKVTYLTGAKRVPATIHEAATKLVAAEVLLNDDNTVLIAETGANIDLKTKYDTLMEEANKILLGKQQLLHLID
tara:strand:- start:701 stop:1807 length:1107 start_codon:yes stop_codon:yes gene_type:complete